MIVDWLGRDLTEADPGEDLVSVLVGHVPHGGDAAGHERRDARRRARRQFLQKPHR